jgi:hypothetical protein
VDLCSNHTIVEQFTIAQHPTNGGKVDSRIVVHAHQIPELVKDTPDWVFGMCEAVRAIATGKTDLITFYYPDGTYHRDRYRIGIDWIPDENGKRWRTLRWIDEVFVGSVIRSGEGCEDSLMATAIILYNLIRTGKESIKCDYSGVKDPTDPLLVVGTLTYHIRPLLGDNWLFRMTLCELSNAYLVHL